MRPQTIMPEHRDLRQISMHLPSHLTFFNIGADIGDPLERRPLLGDRTLTTFSFSSPKGVIHEAGGGHGKNTEWCIGCLLPEITKRGIVDPVQESV